MKRHLQSSCLVAAMLCMGMILSPSYTQAQTQQKMTQTAVAYVYVSVIKTPQVNQVRAFAVTPEGKLVELAGSPFPANIASMAVTGKFLYGAGVDNVHLNVYSIAPSGALTEASSTSAQKYNGGDCGGPGPIFLDHSGASLYDLDYLGSGCSNNTYQSFRVEKPAGELIFLGSDGESPWLSTPLSFIGNNIYAYGAACLSNMYWEIYGFQRHSDGMLTQANISAPTPVDRQGFFYCPSLTAADPVNHVAISFQSVDGETFNPDGPARLATYTAGQYGGLTTNSTRDNMPATAVGEVRNLAMSPSGKLLAVAGTAGLQIFHFNGSQPITRDTGLLTKDEVDQCYWDNDNHLYAISRPAGKLFAFTITPSGVKQVSGSPYRISRPEDLIVLPKS